MEHQTKYQRHVGVGGGDVGLIRSVDIFATISYDCSNRNDGH